jgi:hypothetical protein
MERRLTWIAALKPRGRDGTAAVTISCVRRGPQLPDVSIDGPPML